jgi:hypothetical protein
MSKLRLSLTIPGAVSLGAYEGGALAALIVAVTELGEDNVVIDSIASASAGSITALLTARALLCGVNPIDLLSAAWVDNVSLKAMKAKHDDYWPLSSEALTTMATAVFDDPTLQGGPDARRQSQSVTISMALANLAGLTYDLENLARGTVVQASTYMDWYNVTIPDTATTDAYKAHAQSAIASGSNAIGFPAKNLDRTDDRDAYRQAGLQGFPANGHFWYTDGGTVDNEPLGRTIDLAQAIDSDDERLFLLIHPDPGASPPSASTVFASTAPTPPWIRTGTHAFSMSRAQSIFEDLRRLEKVNSRLSWMDEVMPAVQSGVDAGIEAAGLSDVQADQLRSSLGEALSAAMDRVRGHQARVEERTDRSAKHHDPVEGDWASTLEALIGAASGLEEKDPIKVEVISPVLELEPGQSAADVLAGAFLFHFGGFVDIAFRQSDFTLGYRNMTYWMKNFFSRYLGGVDEDDLRSALNAVDAAYAGLKWNNVRKGGTRASSLSAGEKFELAEIAAHVVHVVDHDILTGEA